MCVFVCVCVCVKERQRQRGERKSVCVLEPSFFFIYSEEKKRGELNRRGCGHSKSDHAHNICHLHNGTFSLSLSFTHTRFYSLSRLVFTIHSNHESTNSSLSDAAISSILFPYIFPSVFISYPQYSFRDAIVSFFLSFSLSFFSQEYFLHYFCKSLVFYFIFLILGTFRALSYSYEHFFVTTSTNQLVKNLKSYSDLSFSLPHTHTHTHTLTHKERESENVLVLTSVLMHFQTIGIFMAPT